MSTTAQKTTGQQVRRFGAAAAALGAVFIADVADNEAEAGTKVTACSSKVIEPGTNIKCVQWKKPVRGNSNKPGTPLYKGGKKIYGPKTAAREFRSYGGYVSGRFGLSSIIRQSDGCYGGFKDAFNEGGKKQVFCGDHIIRGNKSFWQGRSAPKRQAIKIFRSEGSAFRYMERHLGSKSNVTTGKCTRRATSSTPACPTIWQN